MKVWGFGLFLVRAQGAGFGALDLPSAGSRGGVIRKKVRHDCRNKETCAVP